MRSTRHSSIIIEFPVSGRGLVLRTVSSEALLSSIILFNNFSCNHFACIGNGRYAFVENIN